MTAFQLLSCRVEIRYAWAGFEAVFRCLATRVSQPVPVRRTFHYEVRGSSPFEIREDGDLLGNVTAPDDVLAIVYARAYRRTIERFILAGWVVLHGVVAVVGGRRVLILGHKGAGKTTLAARLLYAGHAVEGDELALERDAVVLAMPRLLHLKPGIERHVPELRSIVANLPKRSMGEAAIIALDPTALGFDWRISARPVDAVVWISANHGGATALERRPPFEAIRRIIEGVPGWGEPPGALVATAARLGRSGGCELTLGDPHEGVRFLERALGGGAAAGRLGG